MMFKRVIIAEDHESISYSVKQALMNLVSKDPEYVTYCDHALSWIKKAAKSDLPYDLLITDLSFEEDQNVQEITDGMALIKAAKKAQPDLKVLVFSAEGRSEVIKSLINDLGIHAYVRKARHDAKELRTALEAILDGKTHFPAYRKQTEVTSNAFTFSNYDITIIRLLAGGMKQKAIPDYLQEHGITPAGLSSMEKRLNLIKDVLDFSSNEQLIAYCKDLKII